MTIGSSIKSGAIKLRKQGKSYNEINHLLKIPKSTLSSWLKDYPLSQNVKQKNIKRTKLIWAKNIIKYNQRRSEEYREKTKKLIENYANKVSKVSMNNLFFIGLALFWAEGGKREKWNIRFTNSDPTMIKVMMQFFRKVCQVPNNKFKLRAQLHPNVEEKTAIQFWSKMTKIPKNQFQKTQFQISKSSKYRRPAQRLPYGTLQINIGDAYLNKKIKGWLLGLGRQFDKQAEVAQW